MTDPGLSHLKVLVIDDVPFVRTFVSRVLGTMGITQIEEAADGADALVKLSASVPDLVVLDIMMKPVNGLQFLKTVRIGLGGVPHNQPIIVLTGATDTPVMGTAMALDCDAFVTKNAHADTIREKVGRVLSERAAGRSPEHYRTVDLPDVTQPLPAPSSPMSQAPGPAVVELFIDDVPTGAVVEQDIVTDEGTVLVAEGTVLTASHLARLRDLAAIIEISRIRIRPPA